MTKQEEKTLYRTAGWLIVVYLVAAAVLILIASAQEKPAAPKEPIAISQDEAKVIQVRREAWDERNQRVNAARQEFERAVESRAESRLELLAEVERLRIKYNVPNGWTLNLQTNKWEAPK